MSSVTGAGSVIGTESGVDPVSVFRYMWINKPSKVLSPEYLWQDFKPINPEVHIIRFSGVTKNYAEIRPNA